MHDETDIKLIDLGQLAGVFLRAFRRLFWLVLVLAALGAGLMYWHSAATWRPLYRSEAVFSVSSGYTGATDIMSYSYYYDNSAAEMIAQTFPYVLQTDVMTEMLKNELGVSYINGSIRCSAVEATNLFTLSVTSPSAQDAYDILCAVMNVYPQAGRLVIGDIQFDINFQPQLPLEPSNPLSWKSGVLKGAAAGVLLALIVILLAAVRGRTILSADEARELINLRSLGSIPAVRRKKRGSDRERALLITDEKLDSSFAEAFRTLRVRLARELKKSDGRIITVTSTLASEGKTTVSVNTAVALARDGCRVLLIDADLRNQSVKSALGITTRSTGLGELLSAENSERKLTLLVGPNDLRILAGDATFDNPLELLQSARLAELTKLLSSRFDYIILDAPPAGMMADAAVLSRVSDAVVYVVRSDCAPRAQLLSSVQKLYDNGAKLCGFVFNGAEGRAVSGYGYGYGSYGYSGYSYSKKKRGKTDASG